LATFVYLTYIVGAHASCELCLNASKLLEAKGSKRLNAKGLEQIRNYRSMHLDQQNIERLELEKNRNRARNKKCLFIFGDFMSEWSTKLPQMLFKGNHSKDEVNHTIGTRIYAAECIYGEIEGIVSVVVPGFFPGG
jgi:hypothetical protein